MECGCHTQSAVHHKHRHYCCFNPSLDISETDTAFTLRFELPGVGKDNVHVEVEGDILRVHGKKERPESGDAYIESPYGRFDRKLRLSDNVDKDSISSEFKDGILTIVVKKSDKGKAKSIEIK